MVNPVPDLVTDFTSIVINCHSKLVEAHEAGPASQGEAHRCGRVRKPLCSYIIRSGVSEFEPIAVWQPPPLPSWDLSFQTESGEYAIHSVPCEHSWPAWDTHLASPCLRSAVFLGVLFAAMVTQHPLSWCGPFSLPGSLFDSAPPSLLSPCWKPS